MRLVAIAALAFALEMPNGAKAQFSVADWWVGGYLGDPTAGVTLLGRYDRGRAVELLAGWDVADYLHLSGRILYESPLERDLQPFYAFWGPGVFVELDERGRRRGDTELGISLVGGVGVGLDRLDVYFLVGPHLTLLPGTRGRVGGGLGIRYQL